MKDCEIQMKIGTTMRSLLREEMKKMRQEMLTEFEASSSGLRADIRSLELKMERQSTNSVANDDVVEENDKKSKEKSTAKKNSGRPVITRFVFFIPFAFNGDPLFVEGVISVLLTSCCSMSISLCFPFSNYHSANSKEW